MIRAVNFAAGLVLATFALVVSSRIPTLILMPGIPAGLVLVLLAWSASAAWAALVLIARSDRPHLPSSTELPHD